MKTIRRKHHYTLIEIMTVIVIATILFAIGIPAFSTMIQGSSMTMAIRQFSAKIQAARAYAVTNRCRVAVLMVEEANAANGINQEYTYSAYRVCRIYKNSYTFMDWIEDENWNTLPKGVLRTALPSTAPSISGIPIAGGIGVISSATTAFGIKAIVFDDRGQLDSDSSITINFRQGRNVEGNMVYNERNGDGKIINHPIEITKYTGKVKVKEPEPES